MTIRFIERNHNLTPEFDTKQDQYEHKLNRITNPPQYHLSIKLVQ